ncbi:hypothetical protein J5690_09985 [bacterium]|nr:hypothetical protein [bacterium]
MKKNSLKIVCDLANKRWVYYFKNEFDEWVNIPSESPLSSTAYTNTTMREGAKRILETADRIYNRKNRGLNIVFEGNSDELLCLKNSIKSDFSYRNISLIENSMMVIAVLGKSGAGKSVLIEELTKSYQCDSKLSTRDYSVYTDNKNHAQWYKVKGIDIGEGQVERAFSTLRNITNNGLSAVIYCVSNLYGKLEDLEIKSIKSFTSDFPKVRIVVALTQCYSEDSQITADKIERRCGYKVIQIIAKDKPFKSEPIPVFGLDELSRYIFEGK